MARSKPLTADCQQTLQDIGASPVYHYSRWCAQAAEFAIFDTELEILRAISGSA